MINIVKKVISGICILGLTTSFLSFNSPAFSKDENSLSQNDEQKNNKSVKTELSNEEKESISAKIVSVDVNVDKDQKSYIVRCLGSVKNNSDLILKNVKIKIQLIDSDRKPIDNIPVENIEKVESKQEVPFVAEKFVSTTKSPFDIRALATVSGMETTNLLEIAQWITEGKKTKLTEWNISFNEKDFQNDSTQRIAAIQILYGIPENDKNYSKALDMINVLHYTEGLNALGISDYENAFTNFSKMHPEKKYGEKIFPVIMSFRSKMMFEKAKLLTSVNDYKKALNLLRGISPKSDLYGNSQKEIKKLSFLMRSTKENDFITGTELKKYTEDQQKVIKLMEEKPSYIFTNTPYKNVDTWIFADFSKFIFNEKGELISLKLYPLY